MKIEASLLKNFFEMVSLNDTVSELLLNCTNNGIEIRAVSQDNTSMVIATLKRDAFKEYSAIGTIGLQDVSTVKNVINKFTGVIELIKSENTVMFKAEHKNVEFEIVKEEYIAPVPVKDFTKVEYKEKIILAAGVFVETIADASINKDFTLDFVTTPASIIIANTGKYKFKRSLPATCVGGVTVRFGNPLVNAVNGMTSGDLKVHLNNDFPIYIVQDTAQHKVELIVAPRTEME